MLATLTFGCLMFSAVYGGDIWSAFPGDMVQISAKGEHLWAVNNKHDLFEWRGSQWTQVSHDSAQVAACADESAWVVAKSSSKLWRRLGNTNNFDTVNGMDTAIQINAIFHHSVTSDGKVHIYASNSWTAIGQDAKWAAIGEGDERWMIGKNGSIYRWENHKWEVKPGPEAQTIDVQNEHRVIMTDKENKVYTWQDPEWERIEGMFAKSATINETEVFAVPFGIWRTKVKTCHDSFTVKQDTHFIGCSAAMKSSDGMTEEKCCKKCKKVPSGGGCYYHDKECNVCNGEVKDEQTMKGSVMFRRPLNEP